jgi:glutathione S-transferase
MPFPIAVRRDGRARLTRLIFATIATLHGDFMKLYYAPGACSLASHIALQESGLPYETEKVDLKVKQTAGGTDFNAINPKGYVPALILDSGETLTEGSALLAYIGELAPSARLIMPAGTMGNFRVREWLAFIGTELHKNFGPLFRPTTPEATREAALEMLRRRLGFVSDALTGKPYLTGEQFTVADAYLYTVLRWAVPLKIDLSPWPQLTAFMTRVTARPAVQSTLTAEGLPH